MSGSQMLLLGGNPQQAAVDPYFYSVTSLLHGDGTNGGQNNTFLDSSTNNFTITRNGNTTQGSFSPFSQTGWSNYFDGTGDYLTAPSNAAFAFGTGNFTVEAWIYCTALSGVENFIFDTRSSVSTAGMGFNIEPTTGKLRYSGSANNVLTSSGITTNTWVHVAWVRSGSTLTGYINGINSGSVSNSDNLTQNVGAVGVVGFSASGYFNGYMSNVRVVKGTAVYTANFTPSLTPLTAISGTSLLTCQANRFLDASTNAFAITRNGDVSVQPFSPFNPITPYSTSSIGGSGYFDGSGDYLNGPATGQFAPTGNFTISMWIYPTSFAASFYVLAGSWNTGTSNEWLIQYDNTGAIRFLTTTDSTFSAAGVIKLNQWQFISISRTGNTLTGYVNGTSFRSYTLTGTVGVATKVVYIGAQQGTTWPYIGYMADFRLVDGSAESATPPTAPATAISGTNMLLNYTNGAIFDNAAVADYETVGNAQISTSVKKYGTGSMAFDGTGDWLLTKATTPFDLGTGNMTFECWFYITNTIADYRMLASDATNGNNYICLRGGGTGGQIEVNVAGTSFRFNLNNTVSQSTWTHLAVVRIGTTWIAYINGLSLGTNTSSGSFNLGNGGMYVGRFGGATAYEWPGYIDDLRISKGVARYPYNFTPPTAEFPNIGGTVTLTADPYFDYTTLLLPGNGTNGAQNNTFLDSSTNNFTITRNGNTTQGTFSPFSQTGWGNYFDGTGDWLSVASNAAFGFGAGDFTVEAFVYINAYPSLYYGLIDTRVSSAVGIGTYIDSIGRLVYTNNSTILANAGTIAPRQWVHLAVSRSSGTVKGFINGTEVFSVTDSRTLASSAGIFVGDDAISGNIYGINGYMSNVRVVKGTAVYTSNFTPSTTPLTAISGTSLLTCQSNRFIDNSTNAFAITRNGDVSVQAFSPFNPTAAWSAATNGGSGYFDGSGDYLTLSGNPTLTTNFTIEFWFYMPSWGDRVFLSQGGGAASYSTSNGLSFQIYSTATTFYAAQWSNGAGGFAEINTATSGIATNAWHHVAIGNNGTTTRVWIDGVSIGTNTGTPTWGVPTTRSTYIGYISYASSYVGFGYMAGVRMVTSDVYGANNSTITVPTAPPTAITNTQLLTNFTNAGIYDATSKNDLETVGNAQISTTQSKFGGSSMYFDGTNDGLIGPSTQLASFGTGDFTVESWVYLTTISGADRFLFTTGNGIDTSLRLYIGSTGEVVVYTSFGIRLSSTNPLVVNTWTHVAVRRYNGTLAVYLNGVQNGTASYSTAIDCNGKISVGSDNNGGSSMIGYLDDFRVTKGIARYTSNFTPPTTAFLTL